MPQNPQNHGLMSNDELQKMVNELRRNLERVTFAQIEASDIEEVTKHKMLLIKAKMMQHKKKMFEDELKMIEEMEKMGLNPEDEYDRESFCNKKKQQ